VASGSQVLVIPKKNTHIHNLFTLIRTSAVELKTLQPKAVFQILFNAMILINHFDYKNYPQTKNRTGYDLAKLMATVL
jgi:hypothetical protein